MAGNYLKNGSVVECCIKPFFGQRFLVGKSNSCGQIIIAREMMCREVESYQRCVRKTGEQRCIFKV